MYLLQEGPSLGISGLVYTVIWFPICRGLMSKDKHRFYAAIGMLLFYGSSLKGAFPLGELSKIAWQAHAAGMIVGFTLALWTRLKRPVVIQ
jgi:membrane associated rhomboid family serine protease